MDTNFRIPTLEDHSNQNQSERFFSLVSMGVSPDRIPSDVKDGANVDYIDKKTKRAPIHQAASFGDLNMIKFLVDMGANPDITDEFGRTPLMMAARRGDFDITKYLLSKTKDRSIKDDEGWDTLWYAADGNNLDNKMIRLLLDSGAYDVKSENNNGDSIIFKTLGGDDVDMLKMLISKGADPNHKNNRGKSLKDYAYQMNKTNIKNYLDNI